MSLQEAYHIRDPDSNQNLLWSKRKRFGLKTNIQIWESEDTSEGKEVLKIVDEAILDSFGKFTVVDPSSGKKLGVLKRHFLRSLYREKWTIRDPDTRKEIVTVQARSLLISLIRNLC